MTQSFITVYEHEVLKLGKGKLSQDLLRSLQVFYGEKGVPFYSLIHEGVKFCEYVGVIQVGQTLIEVLPKADKESSNENTWRDVLISMLKAVEVFDVHAPSSGSLNLKPNSILDLYFEIFLNEVDYLFNRGFIKRYNKIEGNLLALKGALHVSKNISKNITHQERFYCKYNEYSYDHLIHQILYQTLILIQKVNKSPSLNSRVYQMLLNFPEVSKKNITESMFDKLNFDRKNESYRNAINIAKLLVLNFHPGMSNGCNNVLAIMFDMNLLWERFVFRCLKKGLSSSGYIVISQASKDFWKMKKGSKSRIQPDIVIKGPNQENVVLDTKWKNLRGYRPSPDDLRQMYVYHEYFAASKVALLYPGATTETIGGHFLNPNDDLPMNMECSILPVAVLNNINEWQKLIVEQFIKWVEMDAVA
jgi:5-methylcytosine-specific restriction enzyme subunit McrC